MKYKILAFDLDGTLTNSEKKITRKTKEALYAAREKGAMIVLASGRPTYGIVPLAKELELDTYGGYIMAYNGGCIIDCKTMEKIYEKEIPDHLVPQLCDYMADRELTVLTYDGDLIIANKDNEYLQVEAKINHMPYKIIEDLKSYIQFPVNKFLMVEHPDVVAGHLREVREQFSELNAFRSAPFFMEIVPPNVDKSEALAVLLEKLGLTNEQLAAFGDGENDAGMLKYAGCGVAMGNAGEECKEVADHITLTNDEDGIAAALQLLMEEE